MKLTEFLLARIAEDEDAAHEPQGYEYAGSLSRVFDPARVLADCEAKRRIVKDWQSLADRLDEQGRPLHLFDPITSMLLKVTEPWLRALASVYAHHPDYRDEWRP